MQKLLRTYVSQDIEVESFTDKVVDGRGVMRSNEEMQAERTAKADAKLASTLEAGYFRTHASKFNPYYEKLFELGLVQVIEENVLPRGRVSVDFACFVPKNLSKAQASALIDFLKPTY